MKKSPSESLSDEQKPHDKAFYEQLDYIMQQFRDGHIKSIPELMNFIEMMYGDYVEFHPEELPAARNVRNKS